MNKPRLTDIPLMYLTDHLSTRRQTSLIADDTQSHEPALPFSSSILVFALFGTLPEEVRRRVRCLL